MIRLRLALPVALAAAALLAPLANAGPRQSSSGDPFAQSALFGSNGRGQQGKRSHSKGGAHVSRSGLAQASRGHGSGSSHHSRAH